MKGCWTEILELDGVVRPSMQDSVNRSEEKPMSRQEKAVGDREDLDPGSLRQFGTVVAY